MREPSRRILFLNDLAALVDGDAEAERRHHELLGENSAVASLRKDVEALASQLGEAGADYAPSPNFQAKLEELITTRPGPVERPARSRERTATRPLYQLNPKSTPPSSRAGAEIEVVVLDSHPSVSPRLTLDPRDQRTPPKGARTQHRPLVVTLLVTVCALATWASYPAIRTALQQTSVHKHRKEPPHTPEAAPRGRHLSLLSMADSHRANLSVVDHDGRPLANADGLYVGQSMHTDSKNQARLVDDAGLYVQLAPNSQLTLVSHDVLQVGGSARVQLPANASDSLTLQTIHGDIHGQGALLVLRSDHLATQVLVLRGEVSVEPRQASPMTVQAFETINLPLRGPVEKAPLQDALPWLEPFATELASLGTLDTADNSRLLPGKHEVQMQVAGDHALVEVRELFPGQARSTVARYTLPLPAAAVPLDVRVGWSTEVDELQEEDRDLEFLNTSNPRPKHAMVRTLQLDERPVKIRSRYLMAVMRDGLGPHLRYRMQAPTSATPPSFSWQVTLLDGGRLSADGADVENALEGRVLRLAHEALTGSVDLRIAVHPDKIIDDGTVHWSTWPDNFELASSTSHDIPAHAQVAALFVRPLPQRVPTLSPYRFLVVVDDSATMAGTGHVLASAFMDELRSVSAAGSLFSMLRCTDSCSVVAHDLDANTTSIPASFSTGSASEGSFNFGEALNATAALIESQGNAPETAALPIHVIILSDQGISSGTSDQQGLARTLPPSCLLSAIIPRQGSQRGPLVALAHERGGLVAIADDEISVRLVALHVAGHQRNHALTQAQLHLEPSGSEQSVAAMPNLGPGQAYWALLPASLANARTAVLTGMSLGQPMEHRYPLGHLPPVADNAVQSAVVWLNGYTPFSPLTEMPSRQTLDAESELPETTDVAMRTVSSKDTYAVHETEALANALAALDARINAARSSNAPRQHNARRPTSKQQEAERMRNQVELDAARSDFDAHPYSRNAHEQFAKALCAMDEQVPCLEALHAWLKQQPLQPVALSLLARAQVNAGQTKDAAKTLGDLVDLDPDDASMQAALGDLLWTLDHKTESCAHLQWAATRKDDAELQTRAAACHAALRDGDHAATTDNVGR